MDLQKLNLLSVAIPKQSMGYLLFCLSGILILVIAGIIPLHFYMKNQDRKAVEVQNQIEEQKELAAVYQTLKKRLADRSRGLLPMPVKVAITKDRMDQVPMAVRDAARINNLSVVSADLDLSALSGAIRILPVNAVVRGDLPNFRRFIISLGQLPYMERLGDLQIRQTPEALEFKVKILVSIS